MHFYTLIRVQALFWEIRNRFFYLLLSFMVSFGVAYQKSNALLYLFVLPYTTENVDLSLSSSIISKAKSSLYIEILPFFDYDQKSCEKSVETYTTLSSLSLFFSYLASTYSSAFFPLLEKARNILSSFFENNSLFQRGEESYLPFNLDFLVNLKASSLPYFSTRMADAIGFKDLKAITFIFTEIEEAFSTQILVCFFFSLVITLPLFGYNLLSFFLPTLHSYESKKWIYQSLGFASSWYFLLFTTQNTIIPKLSLFLLEFQISSSLFHLRAETKIASYFHWATTIFLSVNCLWLFCYLIFFLIKNEKVKVEDLSARRKWCILTAFLLSAFLSPPDLVVQLSFAFFLIFLLELFIFLLFICKYFSIRAKQNT